MKRSIWLRVLNLEILRQRQPNKRFSVPQVLSIMALIMNAVSYYCSLDNRVHCNANAGGYGTWDVLPAWSLVQDPDQYCFCHNLAFHTCTVPSMPPLAMYLPLGDQATACTAMPVEAACLVYV
jgi:hypothetical protein